MRQLFTGFSRSYGGVNSAFQLSVCPLKFLYPSKKNLLTNWKQTKNITDICSINFLFVVHKYYFIYLFLSQCTPLLQSHAIMFRNVTIAFQGVKCWRVSKSLVLNESERMLKGLEEGFNTLKQVWNYHKNF